MSLSFNAVLESLTVDPSDRSAGTVATWASSDASASQPVLAFGNLVDLARLKFDTASAEICDVCNTINFSHAHHCKGCSHKLPAFYAACAEEQEPLLPRTSFLRDRASLTDFAAFVLVVNLLVGIAEFMPLQ